MYFAIYQELKKKIRLPQDLSRNTYLEYRTDEKSSVIFSYTINSGDARDETYSCEEMKHMLEGIFVIGIPMFYGETLQYYFTEIRSDGTKIKSDIGFYLQGASDTVAAGMKYDMLNAVLMLEEEEETGGMRPDGCLLYTSIRARKTIEMNRKIEIVTQRSIREKVLTYLSAQALRNGSSFDMPFNRQELADYIDVYKRQLLGRQVK